MLSQSHISSRIYCLYCDCRPKTINEVALLCHQNHLICRKCVHKLNFAGKETVECLICHQQQHVSQIRVAKINFVDVADEPKLLNEVFAYKRQYDIDDKIFKGNTHKKMQDNEINWIYGLLYFVLLVVKYMKSEQPTFMVNYIYLLLLLEIVFLAFLTFHQYKLYHLYRKGHLTSDHLLSQYRNSTQTQQIHHTRAIVIKTIVMVVVILFGSFSSVYVMVMIGIVVNWMLKWLAKDRMNIVYEIKHQMHSH